MSEKVLDIDVFDSKYTMFTDVDSECFDKGDGRFETFGKDIQTVLSIANGDKPNRVWTATDCDSGFYLFNGYHLCDRVYYIITNEEGNDDEYYLIDEYGDENE
jgi:hypothetical protein